MTTPHENTEIKKKILLAGTVVALGTFASRSWKINEDGLTFDLSIWGEKTKIIYADLMDDAKKIGGRICGQLILGKNNEVEDIITDDDEQISDESMEAWRGALDDTEGWSGQIPE